MAYKQLKLWFDRELAIMLARKIQQVNGEFDDKAFVRDVDRGVLNKELKARVECIADLLHSHLGADYNLACEVLRQILGPENSKETGMFKEYYWLMPVAGYVEKYGLEDFDISMMMLEEITKRNTSEYAIRPFIRAYPDQTLRKMMQWSDSPNRHVRRLASEGGRPRLPWASKLDIFIADPRPLIPILENLRDDSSKYVQKSVANCLNDISKDNVEIARGVVEKWAINATSQRQWIIKHALRTVLKQNHTWANDLLTTFIR